MTGSAPKRFLAAFAATVVAGMVALVGGTLFADPRGIVAAAFPDAPRFCAKGADFGPRALSPYLTVPWQPREILVGTSRVAYGFAAEDARRLLRQPALNLGTNILSLDEAAQLIRHAWASARVERVWLGLEWGMFRASSERRLAIPSPRSPALFALRHGVLDPPVLRRTIAYVRGEPGCAVRVSDGLGFPTEWGGLEDLAFGEARFRTMDRLYFDHFRRRATVPLAVRNSAARTQMRLLGELIGESRARGSQLVLFIAPSHPRHVEAMARAGVLAEYRQWRREVARLVDRQRHRNLLLVDLSDHPAVAAAARRPQCRGAQADGCPFYDHVHYRYAVGLLILRAALSRAPAVSPAR